MKVLIWIGCLFADGLVITLFGYAGILLGALPMMLLFSATYWFAETLCCKWELHTIRKEASLQSIEPFDVVSRQIPLSVLYECEDHRRMPFELKTILKKRRRRCRITRAQADILLEEYMRSEPRSYESLSNPSPPVVTPPTYLAACRRCGAPKIKHGRFCNKCGTPYS